MSIVETLRPSREAVAAFCATLVGSAAALLVAAALLPTVPDPFWGGDACPEREGICGVVPVGLIAVIAVGVGVGLFVYERLLPADHYQVTDE